MDGKKVEEDCADRKSRKTEEMSSLSVRQKKVQGKKNNTNT